MVPARVIVGRGSPSTSSVIEKGVPSGFIHWLPLFLYPARSRSSAATWGLGFHHPRPNAVAISFGSLGIRSPIEGRSESAICWATVGSYGLYFDLPVSISKFFSQSSSGSK